MRVLFLLFAVMTAGAANASSIAVIAPATEKVTASMTVIAPPAVAASPRAPAMADAPQGIDPMVTLSYPFVEGEPPRDIKIVAAPAKLRQISPSVMAMDMPAAPARKIAAAGHRPLAPMVIRGGIAGDAFSGPAEPVPAGPAEPAKPASAPEAATGAKPPETAAAPDAPGQPAPTTPPSPSPATPTRAPE